MSCAVSLAARHASAGTQDVVSAAVALHEAAAAYDALLKVTPSPSLFHCYIAVFSHCRRRSIIETLCFATIAIAITQPIFGSGYGVERAQSWGGGRDDALLACSGLRAGVSGDVT